MVVIVIVLNKIAAAAATFNVASAPPPARDKPEVSRTPLILTVLQVKPPELNICIDPEATTPLKSSVDVPASNVKFVVAEKSTGVTLAEVVVRV